MVPQTPILKYGFDSQPKKPVHIPGIGVIGQGPEPVVDQKPVQQPEVFKNKNLADLAKLDEIEKKRKQRNQHQRGVM